MTTPGPPNQPEPYPSTYPAPYGQQPGPYPVPPQPRRDRTSATMLRTIPTSAVHGMIAVTRPMIASVALGAGCGGTGYGPGCWPYGAG